MPIGRPEHRHQRHLNAAATCMGPVSSSETLAGVRGHQFPHRGLTEEKP